MYYMQEDDIILSQQYCCISWVQPISIQEKIVSDKLFCFFKNHIEEPNNLTFEKILEDYRDYKDKEPVPIYCGFVGKWFPYLPNQKASEDPELPMLMNKALWNYKEHVKKVAYEFKEHTKKEKVAYECQVFDKLHDYLDEDKVMENQQYFCVSFFHPKKEVELELEQAFMKNFMYFFLSEEFKARYSKKGIKDIPIFEHTKDSLWSLFQKSSFEKKQYENDGWSCLKLRGVYASEEEAQKRAEILQKIDKDFRVDVCRIGGWLPFNPPAHLLKSYYADKELDDIMGGLNKEIDHDVIQNLEELHMKSKEQKETVEDDNVEVL